MILYLVRHPETACNRHDITQGHADSPLTKKGQNVAKKLGQLLKNKNISKIYSSDLGRCLQTSRIINQQLHVKIIAKKELREINYGHYNGCATNIIRKKFVLSNPNLVFPRGESFNQMKKRVLKFIKNLKEDQPVLIVTHEGCLRAILSDKYKVRFTSARCNTMPDQTLVFSKKSL